MTATDLVGQVIDRLLERRHGAPYSPKWWKRYHDQTHRDGVVMLACPECPDAAELGQMIRQGPVMTSYDDFKAAMGASSSEHCIRCGALESEHDGQGHPFYVEVAP